MRNKLDECIQFNYFFTKILLCTLIGIEYTLQKIFSKIKDKSIMHNIFRLRSDNSVDFIE